MSACYADEGTTLKRWRPRARGRATRIRKRTCHVTVIVSRMNEEDLARRRARIAAEAADRRARRVAGARRQGRAARAEAAASTTAEEPVDEEVLEIVAAGDTAEATDLDAAVEHALSSEDDAGDDEEIEEDDGSAAEAEDEAEGDGEAADGDERPRPTMPQATRRRATDGPKGQSLWFPPRCHDRLEVPLVRRPQLPGLGGRGLEGPRLPDDPARGCGRKPYRDRAHTRPPAHRRPYRPAGHRHRSAGCRG